MNFIDSNILAYAFYEYEFQENCRNIIRKGGIIDTICLIEAFNIIELQTSREVAIKSIKSLLSANIKIVNTDINIIFEALKRSQTHKQLKFLDLIHYTVAVLKNCDSIASYDGDFDRFEITRIIKI